MNILADEQQKVLEFGLNEEEIHRRTDVFLRIYYELRKKSENSFLGKLTLKQRQKLHKVVLFIFKTKNRLCGFTCDILSDKRSKTDRPVIFAVTHVGKFDIEVVSETLLDHYYLLSGDYEHLQGTIDALFLALNGVIYFNENVKSDRQHAVERMISLLKEGGNLMYFPEGTWNLTPNLPVLPCYWGIVDVAKQGNAIIIPVACEQYGKRFKVNIGENLDMSVYGDTKTEKSRAIADLRDILATLKFDIWESEPILYRNTLVGIEWNEYTTKRFSEWPYFDEEYIKRLIYKPNNIISTSEAFSHLNKLIPNRNNAFLLRAKTNAQYHVR